MLVNAIRKNVNNIKVENSRGDDIHGSKNCFESYGLVGEVEDARYAVIGEKTYNSMDITGFIFSSELYEASGIASANNIHFSMLVRNSSGIEYCQEINNCEQCFGCIGLRNKKYHIFNKPYSEEEYWEKVDEIKTAMLERGEYGEFFPLKYSPVPYQDSNAQVEFPLSKEEVLRNGWRLEDKEESELDLSKINVVQAKDVPDDIKDVSDDILQTPIVCEKTGKPFKITPFELQFYRQMNVPIPTIHPLERIKGRFKHRRPYKLWKDLCRKCDMEIDTIYDPAEKLKVYCEQCYQQEVV